MEKATILKRCLVTVVRTNFAEGRIAELRLIRLLGSSQRPMSSSSAHRFLKIGNLSAGVAARMRPRSSTGPLPRRQDFSRATRMASKGLREASEG